MTASTAERHCRRPTHGKPRLIGWVTSYAGNGAGLGCTSSSTAAGSASMDPLSRTRRLPSAAGLVLVIVVAGCTSTTATPSPSVRRAFRGRRRVGRTERIGDGFAIGHPGARSLGNASRQPPRRGLHLPADWFRTSAVDGHRLDADRGRRSAGDRDRHGRRPGGRVRGLGSSGRGVRHDLGVAPVVVCRWRRLARPARRHPRAGRRGHRDGPSRRHARCAHAPGRQVHLLGRHGAGLLDASGAPPGMDVDRWHHLDALDRARYRIAQ